MTMRWKLPLGLIALAAVGGLGWTIAAQTGSRPKPTSLPPDPNEVRRLRENEKMGMRGIVRGRVVTDDGRSPLGLVVAARFVMHQTGMPGEGSARCDSEGRFDIRGLGKDEFFVGVAGETEYVVPPPVRVDLRSGGTKTIPDLALRLGPLVTIRVRDPLAGKPVAGIPVSVGSAGMGSPKAKTDANGVARFRYGGLRGDLRLDADPREYVAAGGSTLFRSFDLARPEPVDWNVLVYSQARDERVYHATFRGEVVDEQGRPVEGATVRLRRFFDEKTATTGPDGRYAIESRRIEPQEEDPAWGRAPGTAGAVATIEKDGVRTTHLVHAADAWTVPKIVLKAGMRASGFGRVVDEKGVPLVGCEITMWPSYPVEGGSVQAASAVTDAAGRFELKDLDPLATYSFSFGGRDERGALGRTPFPKKGTWPKPFRPGERFEFGTIVVPRAELSLEGVVVDPKGRPVRKDVTLSIDGDHTSANLSPDANGRFRFDAVVDEPIVLRAFASKDGGARLGEESVDRLLTQKVQAGDRKLRIVVVPRPARP